MIRINLLPTREKEQEASQRQELSLVGLILIFVVLIFAGIRIAQGRMLSSLDQEIVGLQKSLEALDVKVKDVADLEQKRKELDAKLKVIVELSTKRVGPAAVLRDLGKATPDRAWLTEFTELKGSATLTGDSVDNQTIAEFLRELSNSSYFTKVDLVETTAQAKGEMRLRKFILKAQVDYAASAKKEPAKGETAKAAAGSPG